MRARQPIEKQMQALPISPQCTRPLKAWILVTVNSTANSTRIPDAATPVAGNAGLVWPLRFGARNSLRLHCWRWSSLGLGGLLIATALALVLALERLRRLLGFGLPELPA